MPTVDENRAMWDGRHDWRAAGDEWSDAWGGSDALWWGTVMPRVHRFVPTGTILEIAPGHGRMTQYLRRFCQRLVVVDLNASCIDACRERFGDDPALQYHVNDGRSLDMVAPDSVDFAFSFDSLVHVDAGVLTAYLQGLARVLRPGAHAFLHHSNLGRYFGPLNRVAERWPGPGDPPGVDALRRRLNRNWRSGDVSAALVADLAAEAGLACVSQETVCWLSRLQNDCFTVVARHDPSAAPVLLRNRAFRDEVRRLASLAGAHHDG